MAICYIWKRYHTASFPLKRGFCPPNWHTSNGTFSATDLVKLELNFPEFLTSERFNFQLGLVRVHNDETHPFYDVIIGIKSLVKIGAIINFGGHMVIIDHDELPMRPHDKFRYFKALKSWCWELLTGFHLPSHICYTRTTSHCGTENFDSEPWNMCQTEQPHC